MNDVDLEDRLRERLTRLARYATTNATPRSAMVEAAPVRGRHRSTAPIWALATAVAVIIGAVAIAASLPEDSSPSVQSHPGLHTNTSTTESLDRGDVPPTLVLDGWTLTGTQSSSNPTLANDSRLLLVVTDPKLGFNGARIKVGIAVPPNGFSAGLNPTPVDVNGTAAQLGIAPNKVYLTWSPAPGHTAYVEGTRATTEQVLLVARGLELAPDLKHATATKVPDGLEVTALPGPPATTTNWAEYKFERAGSMLEVDFYDGGRATFEGRVSDPAHNVVVRGTTGALRDQADTGPGRYWVDFLDGRWTVEVAGGPLPDEASFIAAVNDLHVPN